jgi:hydrogenase expression/formation protein HypC
MKILKIEGEFAKVESGRLIRSANIQMLKNLKIGDYIIMHAGFAIQKVDKKRAEETLRMVREIH